MMGVGNAASSISFSYCGLIPKNPNLTLKTQHLLFKVSSTHNFHFHSKIPATSSTFRRLHARRKDSIAPPAFVSDFDDQYDDIDDDEIDYDDEDDEEFMPFGKMKKWLEEKPRGFGEGKVYDTRTEDKLLEEIEQSRLAQAANINNLKNPNPAAPNKTGHQTKKAPDAIPTGICVSVFNLPKKKNIHRDLKSAFKDVCGILNIIPAVSGNKKTKDPICKGYAFVYFKSEEDAASYDKLLKIVISIAGLENITPGFYNRQTLIAILLREGGEENHPRVFQRLFLVGQFISLTCISSSDWLKQSIAFGKIQKQIKCEMKNSSSSSSFDDKSAGSFSSDTAKSDDLDDSFDDLPPPLVASVMEGQLNADFKMDDSFFEESVSDTSEADDLDKELEDITENVESLSTSDLSGRDSSESRMEPATGSLSLKKQDKKRVSKKKIIAKGGGQKVPKLDIPGSAKRLKMKEKAVLTDVFTKYGLKATMASTKES
ncbi:unnamed protein product [Dovyalis caffra]|uniref:RRM domain-containing protein n=1 Tax=Dovyalis caffra TaxID=77055 RepID=A0AAV1QZ59_9ROSI|nr:unnamed protein product [Dovyalis caffra]